VPEASSVGGALAAQDGRGDALDSCEMIGHGDIGRGSLDGGSATARYISA
jgi:hypothetical protein